jgi:hypothetical protein
LHRGFLLVKGVSFNNSAPLSPPNHDYVTFQLTQFVTGASDSCDTPLSISNVVIEKVTSDEVEDGNGDGNTFNDIVIAATASRYSCGLKDQRAETDACTQSPLSSPTRPAMLDGPLPLWSWRVTAPRHQLIVA